MIEPPDTLNVAEHPLADSEAPNAHLWLGRVAVWSVVILVLSTATRLLRSKK